MDAVPKGSEKDLSNPAVQGVAYCDKLFVYERRLLVRKAVQRVVRIMYLHFGSRVQLTGESNGGGDRQRYKSGDFPKKRQQKTPAPDHTSSVAKTKRNGGSIKATASQARENLSAVRRLFSFAVVRQFAFQYEFWYSADVM